MRREIYRMERREAIAFLEQVPVCHLATTLAEEAPRAYKDVDRVVAALKKVLALGG